MVFNLEEEWQQTERNNEMCLREKMKMHKIASSFMAT
jgi:hypothetical protein